MQDLQAHMQLCLDASSHAHAYELCSMKGRCDSRNQRVKKEENMPALAPWDVTYTSVVHDSSLALPSPQALLLAAASHQTWSTRPRRCERSDAPLLSKAFLGGQH